MIHEQARILTRIETNTMRRIIKIFFYLLLVIVLALIVIYFPKNFSGVGTDNSSLNAGATRTNAAVANPELEKEYENKVKDILGTFSKGEKPENIRERLLDIATPDKYKNIHLDLIFIFDAVIEGAKESDQAKIEDAMQKLEDLKEKNKWMQ